MNKTAILDVNDTAEYRNMYNVIHSKKRGEEVKQHILMYISLLLPLHIFATQTAHRIQEANQLDAQLYRSLVYINKNARHSIVALNHLFPEFPWSTTYKDVCSALNNETTVMVYSDVSGVVNECLKACENLSPDTVGTVQTELEKYKQLLDAGKAHISKWQNDEDIDAIVTRNFDGYREILHLYTRLLTVDGTEIINGALTVNGVITLNGRLFLNGVDINTIIANAVIAAGGITTIQGDIGQVTGTTVSIKGNGAAGAGASVVFSGAGTAMSLTTTDANNNTFVGANSGNTDGANNENTGFGASTLPNLNGGIYNTACGAFALQSVINGSANAAVGRQALTNLEGGSFNRPLRKLVA